MIIAVLLLIFIACLPLMVAVTGNLLDRIWLYEKDNVDKENATL